MPGLVTGLLLTLFEEAAVPLAAVGVAVAFSPTPLWANLTTCSMLLVVLFGTLALFSLPLAFRLVLSAASGITFERSSSFDARRTLGEGERVRELRFGEEAALGFTQVRSCASCKVASLARRALFLASCKSGRGISSVAEQQRVVRSQATKTVSYIHVVYNASQYNTHGSPDCVAICRNFLKSR